MTDWKDWSPTERAVLTFAFRGDEVLLIVKKRGLGTGKVNAPGGRLEAGETWAQAAVRECQEETGTTPFGLTEVADLKFQFVDGYRLQARVFFAQGAEGEVRPCDEADPFWQSVADLPWHRMWKDDYLWLPEVLAGRRVEAQFVFDGDAMLEANLRVDRRPREPFGG